MPAKGTATAPRRGRVAQPRLRVLAGPNGSGKSTIKEEIRPEWLGVFINADEIEGRLRNSHGRLPLGELGITGDPAEVLAGVEAHLCASSFARDLGLHSLVGRLSIDEALELSIPPPYDSYLASVLADAFRWHLMRARRTFTFETVMSSPDKVAFMNEARRQGYRVYLYFVATQDPLINVDRVNRRVLLGGHPVPEKKIRERYHRSIGLLAQACDCAHRAYIFDNSGTRHELLVEVSDGTRLQVVAPIMPIWLLESALWQSFAGA